MAARVQIVVEAKDATSGVFRALTSELGAFGGLVEELTAKNINWGNVGQMAAKMVIDGIKDTIKVTTEYAREVRDLSLASGQGAEQSSRMLQVLDDYQLTAEDAKTATRALTKEGLAPTVDTIAQLSGEYLKLNSVEEKNAFVQKNLGRAGQEWLNLLNQGPDAIRKMNDAVSEGLILTEENVQAAEKYRLALDEWNDSVQALKISIGNELIPALTGLIETTAGWTEASKQVDTEYDNLTPRARNFMTVLQMQAEAWHADKVAIANTYEATTLARDGFVQLEPAITNNTEDLKLMNAENQQFISVLGNVKTAQDTYYGGLAAAKQQLDEGKISTEEHSAKVNQLAADYQLASKQIVLSIVEMKLATDGWTDAELTAYLKVGTQMGIFTQNQVNMAEGALKMADQIVAGAQATEGPMTHAGERAEDAADAFGDMADAGADLGESMRKEVAGGAAAATAAINSIPKQTNINVDIFVRRHGSLPSFGAIGPTGLHEQVGTSGGGFQQGGEVFAGSPTWVGEGGREPFIPAMNGRILGHAESLHALSMANNSGGSKYGPFYGPVTIQTGEDGTSGLMGIR